MGTGNINSSAGVAWRFNGEKDKNEYFRAVATVSQGSRGAVMDLSGQTVKNRYEVLTPFNEGVLSCVYKVRDLKENKESVLKLLKTESISNRSEDLIRFKRTLSRMLVFNTPFIACVRDQTEIDGQPCLIMEYVEGQSLPALFREGRKFSIAEASDIIHQTASALEYAHSQNLLHLDLRASNIMLQIAKKKIKVLDFGLSYLIEYARIKNPEHIKSVFSYISPEQSGIMKRSSDERSDLYSLGIIFYELLTGELPFKGRDIGALLHDHMARLPVPLRKLNPEIPEVLEQMVLKLISKEPESRYQTASGFLADLEQFRKGDMSFIIGKQDRLKKVLFRTRIIGREEEFNRLINSFEKIKTGEGQVCMVRGEAGMGKSRLVDEIRSHVYSGKGLFLSGRCFSQEHKIPYLPFRDILHEFLDRIKKMEIPQRAKRINRMKEILGEMGEIICKINPDIKEILGEQPALLELDPEREHRRFLMAASRFFLNLGSREEPMVYFMDDLQWSDEASLSLLSEMFSQIKDFPVLVIGTYRDNEVNQEHSLFRILQESRIKNCPVQDIPLNHLDQKYLTRVLAELLIEDEAHVAPLSDYVLQKSGGNPFFSLEITRQIIEEGGLVYGEQEKHWKIDRDKLNRIKISNNIIDVVLRRIDTLDEDKISLLCYASVIGREFSVTLLRHLTGLSEEKLINLIDECIFLQLLEKSTEKGKVLFVHDRIRDAFYIKIPDPRLEKYHLQIAQAIEALSKDNIEAVIFDLAHHYTEAKEKDKALTYCLPAAHRAKQNYANEEAIRYYNLAVSLLEEKGSRGSGKWVEAKEGLTETFLTTGRSDECIAVTRELLPLKTRKLDKARIYKQMGNAYFKKGDWDNSEKTLSQSLSLLGEKIPIKKTDAIFSMAGEFFIHILHSLFPRLFSHHRKAPVQEEDREKISIYFCLFWLYIFSDIFKLIRTSLKILNLGQSRVGKSKELVLCLGAYGALCACIPLFKRSEEYLKKGLTLAKEMNDLYGSAQIYGWSGVCYNFKSKFNESLAHTEKGLAIAVNSGLLWEEAILTQNIGYSNHKLGNYPDSLKGLQRYLEISQNIKDEHGVCCAEDLMGLDYTEMGQLDKAGELLQRSIRLSQKAKIWFVFCRANAEMGYLLMERGQYDEAIKYLEKAREIQKHDATFMKDYLIYLYTHLAESRLEKFKIESPHLNKKEKRRELKRINKARWAALLNVFLWKNHYGGALRVNAKYHALKNRNRRAERYFLKSVRHCRRINRKYELGRGLYDYGLFLASLNRPEQAKKNWQEAYDIFRGIGARLYLERSARALGITLKEETRGLTAQERLAVERRLDTLVTVSHHLSSILDLEELLSRIVDSAIEVSGAERGFLLLFDPEKKDLQVRIAKGLDPGLELIPFLDYKHYKLCRAVISCVREKTASLLFNPQVTPELCRDEDIKTYRIRSVICTPLKVRNELLGLLYLDNRFVDEAFDEQDLNLINSFAIQAGISLQNAYFVKEMVEKERLSEELRLGREIQIGLLPHRIPEIEGLKVQGLMIPAKEIGGDYYDFITMPERGKLGIVIGDVSGKGVAAGLCMAMVKTAIHIFSRKETSPKAILLHTNQVLNQHIGGEKFMTMLFLLWDASLSAITYSSAGHEHILIYRSGQDQVEAIQSGGIILGVMPDINSYLEEKRIPLNKGDKILLYTDGITEAHNAEKDRMGLEKLKILLKKHGLRSGVELIQAVKEEVFAFIGTTPQYDDITLVVLEAF